MVDAWLAAEGDDNEACMERFADAMFVRSDSEGSLVGELKWKEKEQVPASESQLHGIEVRGGGWGRMG